MRRRRPGSCRTQQQPHGGLPIRLRRQLPARIAYSNSGSISQTLATMLQPNTTYTLLVDVGRRLEAGLTADYSLTLQAGSTVLATIRASNITASAGYFQTQSLFYTPPASPPAGNITIVLTSYGPQVNFKNVRLNLSSPSTVHYYFSDHLGSTDRSPMPWEP